jgi:hypothetical protein
MAYHYFSGVCTAGQIFRSEFLNHVRGLGSEIVSVTPFKMEPEDGKNEVKEYLVVTRQAEEDDDYQTEKKHTPLPPAP